MISLIKCKCGAMPQMAYDETLTPGAECWAIHCSEFCGEDTHWQGDLEKAAELWNAGETRNQRGGQYSENPQFGYRPS